MSAIQVSKAQVREAQVSEAQVRASHTRADRLLSLVAGAALALTAACDPCTGVVDCRGAPQLSVGGRVLDTGTGISIPNATVRVVARTAGFADSVTTTTAADGRFVATLPVPTAGLYSYDLVVQPPGLPGYRWASQRCEVGTIRGEGCEVGSIASKPWFPYLLRIIYRGPDSVQALAINVRFTPTAGPALYGDSVINGEYTDHPDLSGAIGLLGLYVFAEQPEMLTGDLTVRFTDRGDSSIVRGVALRPTTLFREGPYLMDLRAGPSLAYTFAFTSASTGQPLPGVKVTFAREAGVETATSIATAVSNDSGTAHINLRPLATGSVTGTLTVEPPSGGGFSESVTLATHDDDLSPVARTWSVSAPAAAPAAPAARAAQQRRDRRK